MTDMRHLVGVRARQRRRELDLNQADIAERMGVEQSFISQLERGATGLKLDTLGRLASALNTTSAYLLGEERAEANKASLPQPLNEHAEHHAATISIPVAGGAWAGTPWPVPDEQIADWITIPEKWVRGETDMVAVTVMGNSFDEEHICNGDQVIIARRDTYHDGELVACTIRGEAPCLKRIYYEDGQLVLQAGNRDIRPIVTEPEGVEILGRVCLVCRHM